MTPQGLLPGWAQALRDEFSQPYFEKLALFLKNEHRAGKTVFPSKENVLRALRTLDLPDVRVVILGQDPYHGPGQAIGLSFAVPNELTPKPPSLLNIFKELEADVGFRWNRKDSDLSGWLAQGVLLLNTVLTVRQNQAFSHRDQGWEHLTDRIIQLLGEQKEPIVFILWGAASQKKKALIPAGRHCIIESPHPSPLSASRGFFGSKPFSRANRFLAEKGRTPVEWSQVVLESVHQGLKVEQNPSQHQEKEA